MFKEAIECKDKFLVVFDGLLRAFEDFRNRDVKLELKWEIDHVLSE
jgi:hypothetical protein